MKGSTDGRRVLLVVLVGFVVVTAGCTGGPGTKTYTGANASAGDVHLQSAKVVDGTLRRLTVANNGSSAVSSGMWDVRFNGTSNKKTATYNTTVDVKKIPADSTRSVTIDKGSQPDWQDGAKLTIQAVSPGGNTTSVTIRPQ